ncbi:MAG: metalloprotease PmbA [Pseudomonadales bacterium]
MTDQIAKPTRVASEAPAPIDLRAREAEIQQRVADILTEAKRQGASAAEVVASEDLGLGVTVRMGELENVEFNQDRGFGITVYRGQRRGSASTSDSRPEAIADTVRAALNIARYTQEDEYAGLADAELMPEQVADLALYHPWPLDADQARDLALACESAGLEHDARIVNSDGASVSSGQMCRVYGNSHGFVGGYLGTRHSVSCMLIAQDDNGMQRDYWYSVARDAESLEEPASVGRTAGERTVQRLSPRSVSTGTMPVVFSPQMSMGLMGHVMGALSGGAVYKKASFLHDALGQQALSSHIKIHEQPHLLGQLGSAAFDGEGVATWDKNFVAEGVIRSWMMSSYSARRLGLATTGNAGGAHNLTLAGRTLPKQALLKEAGSGLYVTELMGQGVNGVTGDYSRGASGFWFEDGELQYPVDGVTIAGNLKSMLLRIEAIGDDLDIRGNYRAPSVWIDAMTVAGA